ncbi:beta glucosidase [Meredithblackwellia eburnea MCA 4105]
MRTAGTILLAMSLASTTMSALVPSLREGAEAGKREAAQLHRVKVELVHQSEVLERRDVVSGDYTSPKVLPAKNITVSGNWYEAVRKARKFVKDLTLEELVNITTGAGIEGRCVGNTGTIPRVGFPGLCLQDSPLGVRFADFVSAFPAGINVAATWKKELMYQRGAAMGAEFRGKGVNVALGPMMNLGRVAAGGRNWEGFGADPYLAGIAAAETIKGIQSNGVIACAKHFIGNEQEHFRGGSGATAESSNIDDRTMHEVYAWPFAESVRAGVGSVMCSYQRVNQTFSCENSKILNGLLKEELDFQGFVVTDWAAMEAGVDSALAGTDMNMPGFYAYGDPNENNPAIANYSYWGAKLVEAVNNGSVPLTRVQDMVARTMAAYYQLGQDADDYPAVNFNSISFDTYTNGTVLNEHINVQSNHYKLIREIGAVSTVLLKNTNQTLPLNPGDYSRWGIFGSDAGPSRSGPNGCVDRGCDDGTLAMGWGSGTANFPYLVDPLSAIRQHVLWEHEGASVEAVLDDSNAVQLQAVARRSGVCLVFVNSDSGEGYLTVDGNAGDRNNLTLWHQGEEVISNVTSQCSNTVVVVHAVGPVLMESWIENPNVTAVLYAGLPGQESGNAIVDVLFGYVNPSGRLPYTIAKERSDYGADVLYSSTDPIPQVSYTEELLIDYRWFDAHNITPRFEFGFGLSYTSFLYSGFTITEKGSLTRRDGTWMIDLYSPVVEVSFTLTNSGRYDGCEVSQLYLEFPSAAGEPPKVLRGFESTYLQKGQTQTIWLSLSRKDISVWDVVSQSWIQHPGTYRVLIGQSSRNVKLTGSFVV